jgi:hypothetical protein
MLFLRAFGAALDRLRHGRAEGLGVGAINRTRLPRFPANPRGCFILGKRSVQPHFPYKTYLLRPCRPVK